MRPGLRSLGCGLALVLLALLGITLWVGMRVGIATVAERGRATPGQSAGLPGVAWVRGALGQGGHGLVAEVDRIEGATLWVTDRQGEPRVVLVTAETRYLTGTTRPGTRLGEGGLAQFPELGPGARLIVLGWPRDDGVIEARVLRLVPPDAPLPERRRRDSP